MIIKITNKMIERGAKVLYEQHPLSPAMPAWEDLADTFKVEWWRRIRKVLEAITEETGMQQVQELEERVEELEQEAQGADKVLISIALRCKEAETRVKELESALRRLLNQFDSRRKWPKIAVRVTERWVAGAVDDECRDAIRYAGKVLGGGELDE